VEGLENGTLFLREADRQAAGRNLLLPSEMDSHNGSDSGAVQELEAARVRIQQRADQAEQHARRLAELSRKARRGQANVEELQELEYLEELFAPPSA